MSGRTQLLDCKVWRSDSVHRLVTFDLQDAFTSSELRRAHRVRTLLESITLGQRVRYGLQCMACIKMHLTVYLKVQAVRNRIRRLDIKSGRLNGRSGEQRWSESQVAQDDAKWPNDRHHGQSPILEKAAFSLDENHLFLLFSDHISYHFSLFSLPKKQDSLETCCLSNAA